MATLQLDSEICYRALRTRDRRFDGRFFTAVRSTGVYCRPVCSARTPKRGNCLFFACAAAAHEAGFRPCLRCRPEAAPTTAMQPQTCGAIARALRLIADGALDVDGDAGAERLAARLGIDEGELRELFLQDLGATPLAVARTRRLLFAKKLIDETLLPLADIGPSCGVSTAHRRSEAMRATYGRTPTELRARSRRAARRSTSDLELTLPFRSPFDWTAIVQYLSRRATPGVETASTDAYRRTVAVDGGHGVVEVRPVPGANHLIARIRLAPSPPTSSGPRRAPAGRRERVRSRAPRLLQVVVERLRRIFDLDADPMAIAAHLGSDPELAAEVAANPGLRIPGAWDGFELAVRAILGQQVSVDAATTVAGRLAEAYGAPLRGVVQDDEKLRFVFPEPRVLMTADLRTIGLPGARARAVSALAAAVAGGALTLDASRDLDATIQALATLPGIGDWTAQYIAMRALREPDAFPTTDLGLRRALGTGLGVASHGDLAAAAESWRPWRAYAAVYLWSKDGKKAGKRAEALRRTRRGTTTG
jgi:AraC family transcriptional regulator of adaptative response / DNA-3-methyladenine glycosylase II